MERIQFGNYAVNQNLDICVCNPVTKNYTTFEIIIQTSNPAFNTKKSHTRRRYSDFIWLKKLLKIHHPLCVSPELPEKKQSSERFEPQFLVQRMRGLEEWLKSVVSVDLYLSDTSLHLFLQSNLTCQQIEKYAKGDVPEGVIQNAYRACEWHTHSDGLDKNIDSVRTIDDDEGAASGTVQDISDGMRSCNNRERYDSDVSENCFSNSSSDLLNTSYVTSLESDLVTEYPPVTEVSRRQDKIQMDKKLE